MLVKKSRTVESNESIIYDKHARRITFFNISWNNNMTLGTKVVHYPNITKMIYYCYCMHIAYQKNIIYLLHITHKKTQKFTIYF